MLWLSICTVKGISVYYFFVCLFGFLRDLNFSLIFWYSLIADHFIHFAEKGLPYNYLTICLSNYILGPEFIIQMAAF